MFGEIFGFLRDTIEFIWPFRIVHQTDEAGYFICGRWWKKTGPGLKFVVPWFCYVRAIAVVPHVIASGRQDITLSDGSMLSFDATATGRVFDSEVALVGVEDCDHAASLLLGSVLAEKLAEVDAARLAPDKRGRLISDLARWVNKETSVFGIETTDIRFTSFVLNVRTYRLLNDASASSR